MDAQGIFWADEFSLPLYRMTVLAWLALFLSWGSLGLETATVVVSSPRKTALVSGAWAGGIGSELDCHGRDCWLQLKEDSYRRPTPNSMPKLCVCVFVCDFYAHCAKL